jgi:DNA topoisomerase-6 subunit B
MAAAKRKKTTKKPATKTATRKPKAKASPRRRATAESMAKDQREISVSEFFAKNRHLLGFDNLTRALLTSVKEAVDNALDACEEAGILPEIIVKLEEKGENRFKVTVEDNGPGVVKKQIPSIFGKLLYGSKFHRRKMSRGQQGIGISAAGLYGQMTTGKPTEILSRTGPRKPAFYFEISINTTNNEPEYRKAEEVEWDKKQGTRVAIEMEARYQKGRQSVDDYIHNTAVANPHATFHFYRPGEKEPVVYERGIDELPVEAKEIKPHPYGVELGILIKMLHATKSRSLSGMLAADFSRVSAKTAKEICKKAKLSDKARPTRIARQEAEALFKAINQTKIMSPPTNCLSPIGEEAMEAGLRKMFDAEWYTSITRSPSVYRGNPFQIEVAVAYGGSLPADDLAVLYRFANRVPLLYQQGACSVTKAVLQTSWKSYGLQQARGALPTGPLVVMVHVASVWVPFTSEAKEAVAHYPEIIKEIKLAVQEAGRRLGKHIRKHRKAQDTVRKHEYIEGYVPHIGAALREILGLTKKDEEKIVTTLRGVMYEGNKEAIELAREVEKARKKRKKKPAAEAATNGAKKTTKAKKGKKGQGDLFD